MTKKQLIILIGIIIIILIAIIAFNRKKADVAQNKNNNSNVEISYDEETSLYYIKDEETGEIVSASYDETDLEFYKENPDYNPNPLAPKTTNLDDYINYEESLNEVESLEHQEAED